MAFDRRHGHGEQERRVVGEVVGEHGCRPSDDVCPDGGDGGLQDVFVFAAAVALVVGVWRRQRGLSRVQRVPRPVDVGAQGAPMSAHILRGMSKGTILGGYLLEGKLRIGTEVNEKGRIAYGRVSARFCRCIKQDAIDMAMEISHMTLTISLTRSVAEFRI